MAASKNNQYHVKFKSPAERVAVCEAYVNHCKQGLSDDCFPECDRKTLQSYVKKYPNEFPPQKIERAKRERQLFWERLGIAGTMGITMSGPNGKNLPANSFNTAAWIFNMKNRFNWTDRQDVTTGGKGFEAPTIYLPDNKRN